MGYRTPNIDRIADERMRFTDSYGEQSCTVGRSSFITGQSVYRTGMSKVGVPGADVACRRRTPACTGVAAAPFFHAENVLAAELTPRRRPRAAWPLGRRTGCWRSAQR
jgi:hypothetical protein